MGHKFSKVRRIIIRCVIILSLLVLFMLFITGVPIRIDADAFEIVFREDSLNLSHMRYERVIMRGRYRIVPFSGGRHRFRGTIYIEGHPITYAQPLMLDLFQRPGDNFRTGFLQYRPNFNTFGTLYTRPFFRHPWLIVVGGGSDGGSWAGDLWDSPVIVPNATNRLEAICTISFFIVTY